MLESYVTRIPPVTKCIGNLNRLLISIVVVVLGVGITSAQQEDELDKLRLAIVQDQAMMQRYPELKNDIQAKLQDDLKAIIGQIGADLDYLTALQAKRPSDTLNKSIAGLQAELTRYRSLQQDQTGKGSGKGSSVVASPTANQSSPSPTPAQSPAPTPPQQVPSNSAQSSGPTPSQPPSPQQKPPEAKPQESSTASSTVQNVLPSSLVYWIDISKNPGNANKKGCSNRPLAHDAGIWNVVVSVRPKVPQSDVSEKNAELLNYYTVGNTLFLPVQRIERNSITLVAGKRTYTATMVERARSVAIAFEDLTLAEAGDVIDQLTKSPDKITSAYTSAGLTLELYRADFSAPDKLKPADYYAVIKADLQPKDVKPLLQSAAVQQQPLKRSFLDPFQKDACQTNPAIANTDQCKPLDITIQVQQIHSPDLSHLLQNVQIDTAILQTTKDNLAHLINSQDTRATASHNENESDKAIEADKVVGVAQSLVNKIKPESQKAITIIDNPCLFVSIAPSSAANFKPVINFKTRYDYFSPSGAFFLKLKAEGDAGDDNNYFQRLQAGGEASGLVIKGSKGLQLSAGGVGHYSVSRLMGVKLEESNVGGKLELQTPFLVMFNTLPGSNSKPTLTAEFVSSQPAMTKTNAFDFNAAFAYTLRPTTELSFDMNGTISKSSQRRFAGDDFNSYFFLSGRYTLFSYGDYLVKYECGRKEPDFRKVCGWQTGFETLVGR